MIYYWVDHIKWGEMCGTCNTHGRYEKYTQSFCRKIWLEKNHLQYLCVDGMKILEWIL